MAFSIQEISGDVEASVYAPRYLSAIGLFAKINEENDRPRRRLCATDSTRDAYFLRLRQSSDPRDGTRYLYALLVRGGHFIFEELRYNEYKVLAMNGIPQDEARSLSVEAILLTGRRMNKVTTDLDGFNPVFR